MICKHREIILYPTNIENKFGNIVIKDLEEAEIRCRNCNKPIANEDMHLYAPNKRFVGIPKGVLE